jgi:hypothetical protein
MAAVYAAHAATVGPAVCLPYLLTVLDETPSCTLRENLLRLVLTLIAPAAAGWDVPVATKAAAAARANATEVVQAGGVELLVDLATMAHVQPRTVSVGLGGPALLMDHAQSEADSIASWWWYDGDVRECAEPSADGAASFLTTLSGHAWQFWCLTYCVERCLAGAKVVRGLLVGWAPHALQLTIPHVVGRVRFTFEP